MLQKIKEKIDVKLLIPWFILTVAYIGAVALVWYMGIDYLDSDMSAEMVLAHQLNQEGTIISKNWFYSTELRVVCEQLLFKIGLWLSPNNWHVARTIAQAIMLAIVAFSYLLLANGAKLGKGAIYFAAILMCPFGYWYLFHGVFGGFYFTHMILIMLSLGLLLQVMKQKENKKRQAVLFVGMLMVCFGAGLNGVRILMNLYAPLTLAAVLLIVMKIHETPKEEAIEIKNELMYLILSVSAAVAAACGYFVNSHIFKEIYYFKEQENRVWTLLSLHRIAEAFSMLLSIFGYPYDSFVNPEINKTVPLFTITGILGACGLAMAGLLLMVIVLSIVRLHAYNFEQKCIVVTTLSCIVVTALVFALTNDMDSINGSYWLPIVPLLFLLMQLVLSTEKYRLKYAQVIIGVCIAFCILSGSYVSTKSFMEQPVRAKVGMKQVADWLLENGYTKGYGNFWDSNLLVELSNGQLEVWDVNQCTLETNKWLQSMQHLEQPEGGPLFVLTTPDLDLTEFTYIAQDESNKVYEDENGYKVFLFNSYEDMNRMIIPEE